MIKGRIVLGTDFVCSRLKTLTIVFFFSFSFVLFIFIF